MVCGHNQYHALSATSPATERRNGEGGLKIQPFQNFQELRPEFPGMGSEQQNYKLRTKQKGMTPMNTLIKFSDALCHPVLSPAPYLAARWIV